MPIIKSLQETHYLPHQDGRKRFWFASVFLMVMSGLLLITFFIGQLNKDGSFGILYRASQLFLHHQNAYDANLYPGHEGFVYPPSVLLLLTPLSCFSYRTALHGWDMMCFLLATISIYMWIDLLSDRRSFFSELPFFLLASFIAPLLWSFLLHTLIIPTFIFATAAVWLFVKKKSSFMAGGFCALALMKPHLIVLLVLFLFIRSSQKLLFTGGIVCCLLLSAIPFFIGYRPLSDLHSMAAQSRQVGLYYYVLDDQNIASQVIRITWIRNHYPDLLSNTRISKVQAPASLLDTIHLWKSILWAVAAIIFLSLSTSTSDAEAAAWALAIGVCISIYSHAYDGTLLVPAILSQIANLRKHIRLELMALPLFLLNMLLTFMLPYGLPWAGQYHRLWDCTTLAWISTIYMGIALACALTTSMQEGPLDYFLHGVHKCVTRV